MRLMLCLIPLLCGCGARVVRCDSHLQPINPLAASGIASSRDNIVAVRRVP